MKDVIKIPSFYANLNANFIEINLRHDKNSFLGRTITFTYDGDRLLTLTDFAGSSYLTNRYDPKGRVISQDLAGQGPTYANYDETACTTTFTDARGQTTTYTYDEFFHITAIAQGTSLFGWYETLK